MINNIDVHHLTTIKSLVLKQAGIFSVKPADCKILSDLIKKKTNFSVSETTLKRVFGFALSKFDPSYFTLNALAVYCGYVGWDSFLSTQVSDLSSSGTGFDRFKRHIKKSLDADNPLVSVLIDNFIPTIILKANAPDFTIITYNKAYESASFGKNMKVKGLSLWEAFSPDKAGGSGPTLLLEAFYESIFTKQVVKMEPLQYNIQSPFSNTNELGWWDVKITPVVIDNVVKLLVVNSVNITDKILHQDAIEEAIISELTMAEDLAKTNIKLNVTLASLADSHQELLTLKDQLEEVNATLEQTVFDRTKKFFDSEARQRQLVDNAPVGIGVLKGDHHVVETANKKLVEYWGKSGNVTGKPLDEVLPEIKDQPFIDILNKVRDTGIPYINPELCAYLDYNGVYQPRYFDMIYQPIQTIPHTTDCIFIVAFDITDHVLARKKLEESESLLRLAVNAASLGTWHFDPVTRIMTYNNVFAQILGWDGDGLMTYDDAVSQVVEEHRQRLVAEIHKAIDGGGNYDVTYPQKRFNDGRIIWLRSIGKITADANNKISFSGIIAEVEAAE